MKYRIKRSLAKLPAKPRFFGDNIFGEILDEAVPVAVRADVGGSNRAQGSAEILRPIVFKRRRRSETF